MSMHVLNEAQIYVYLYALFWHDTHPGMCHHSTQKYILYDLYKDFWNVAIAIFAVYDSEIACIFNTVHI